MALRLTARLTRILCNGSRPELSEPARVLERWNKVRKHKALNDLMPPAPPPATKSTKTSGGDVFAEEPATNDTSRLWWSGGEAGRAV